jgi:hypothetical protein
MAFKLFEEAKRKREEEWNSHLSPTVREWVKAGKPITWEQFDSRPMNSYERESLYQLLDNEALIKITELFLKNCCTERIPGRPCSTYSQALEVLVVPELLKRFKEATGG